MSARTLPSTGSSSDPDIEKRTVPLILVDADNTLWDTDSLFAEAQLQLLESVEDAIGKRAKREDRLDFVREVDQAIAQSHHLGLKYPPRLLSIALAHSLLGLTPEQAAETAWVEVKGMHSVSGVAIDHITEEYSYSISRVPKLRPGVRKGLSALKDLGAKIIVLTEGPKRRVVANLKAHELLNEVARVIEATKTVDLFRRLLKLATEGQPVIMIGDQLSRDILPAATAGLRTIYIPAAFKPRWEDNLPCDVAEYNLSGFGLVPNAVAELDQKWLETTNRTKPKNRNLGSF